jgi:hypothetical protein
VRASKFGVLFLILGFGGTVETAYQVRNRFGVGPWDWQVLTGNKWSGPSYNFEETESQAVPAGTAVEVDNAFGGVQTMIGPAGEVKVRLRKVVYRRTEAEAETFAQQIRLARALDGGTLRVGTNRREVEAGQQGNRVGFETHLEITLPPGTRLKVVNEHGAIDAADVAEATLVGSFDSIRLDRVAGAASIEAQHGDVAVADVAGTLALTARHGSVEMRNVKGRATVEVEHGDVTANEVGGLALTIRHGELSADGILGDLSVTGEHAGVQAAAITGRVVVETGFQDVLVERVGGDVRVVSKHGAVHARDVAGAIYAEAGFDDVALERIAGPVEVRVTHGGLKAESLEKGGLVRTAGDDVIIDGFKGGLDVQSERGNVRLTASGPMTDATSVRVTQGGIDLEVAEGSRFALDATSGAGGEISANVAGLTTTESTAQRLTGTMGGGGSKVSLSAEGGNIELRSARTGTTTENRPAENPPAENRRR